MSDIPILTSENDWLDYATDEQVLVRGKISNNVSVGSKSILVSFTDWSQQVVDIISEGGMPYPIIMSTEVDIFATTTEDGLVATSDDVNIRGKD